MISSNRIRSLGLAVALMAATFSANAQFNITGVADKANPYANTVTFTVGIQAGYSYAAFLNNQRIPVGVPVTVTEPDFYQLNAFATNVVTSAVSTQLVRFIVEATERVGTEWGLPPHTPSPAIPPSNSVRRQPRRRSRP